MTWKFKIRHVFEVLMQTTLFSGFGTAYTEIPLHLHVGYQNILIEIWSEGGKNHIILVWNRVPKLRPSGTRTAFYYKNKKAQDNYPHNSHNTWDFTHKRHS